MAVGLYMDVHVPQAITEQLRRRGVDVLTAIEDGRGTDSDDQLLERSTALGRVLFTQDIRFKAMAEDWQSQGRQFQGLLFGRQLGATVGQYVSNLEMIAVVSEPNEWGNVVQHPPF
jgi:hypothetical protein